MASKKKSKVWASHSRYWLDRDVFRDKPVASEPEEKQMNAERILRLATARRAVSNFVNILTGRSDIPVLYSSGKESYTDGKQVVISADDNPEHFDSMVGLALHEGSHCLLTNFDFLQRIASLREELSRGSDNFVRHLPLAWGNSSTAPNHVFALLLHPDLVKALPLLPEQLMNQYFSGTDSTYQVASNDEWRTHPFWNALSTMLSNIHMVMNIVEDRRIDKYVYQNAGGYRPYYNALYDRYFFTDEAGKNLKYNPEWRTLTVDNYLKRLLYAFHPDSDLDAMPGLRQLVKLMDLNTIERIAPENDPKDSSGNPKWLKSAKYKDAPRLWQLSNQLYAHILKFVAEGQQEQEGQVVDGMPVDMILDALGDDSDLPNLDGGVPEFVPVPPEMQKNGKPGKYNAEKGEKEYQKAKEALDGKAKKKKVTKQEKDAVAAMEQADAKIVDLKGDGVPHGKCIVTRRLTEALFKQELFIFKRYAYDQRRVPKDVLDAIAAGKRMGQILVHRLQVRNDPLFTKQTRLDNGGLDRRLLAQLGMDITNVFQKSRTDHHRPVMLHLTIDGSGSMMGMKWNKVMTVAVALAYVGSKIRNVDTVISVRGGHQTPIVNVVFDSRRDQFAKFVKFAGWMEASGGTPEGLCFAATLDLILECTDTHDVYFINFSDGEPSFGLKKDGQRSAWELYFQYYGEVAAKHTRIQVNKMRDKGVKILSYFISGQAYISASGHEMFRQMYGEDAAFVDVSNSMEVLRTLNKLLLKRGA